MAPKPDGLALIFGMVLAMAMVATWAAPLNPESESLRLSRPGKRFIGLNTGGCPRQTVPDCLRTVRLSGPSSLGTDAGMTGFSLSFPRSGSHLLRPARAGCLGGFRFAGL